MLIKWSKNQDFQTAQNYSQNLQISRNLIKNCREEGAYKNKLFTAKGSSLSSSCGPACPHLVDQSVFLLGTSWSSSCQIGNWISVIFWEKLHFIFQIFDNSPTAKDGILQSGDEIIGINGQSVKGKTKVEVAKLIQNCEVGWFSKIDRFLSSSEIPILIFIRNNIFHYRKKLT